jgi:DNA mismatch repair protein MutL
MAAAGDIRILPPEVAARIAAGEVIERPASVVRELLDNAIDAGARRIMVEIEEGGLALIRVVDDGRGIPPEQVELAFERHATSKLDGTGDLGRIATLGFRGEALPSIAAAAEVDLVTRHEAEPLGVHLVLSEGRPIRRAAKPSPPGTSFAARDLFARLPARRKFLGTPVAEARQISVLAAHYALAYPAIACQLASGGRRLLSTSGDGDLRHAFASVYGAESARQMLTVGHEEGGVVVEGLAGPPSLYRGNRAGISVFVNGRWVQSRPLTFAVVDAYQSQVPVGRHPLACLSLRLASEDVDVNVHPAKAEVRFRDERAVARAVRHAVALALEAAAPPAFAVAAAASPGREGAPAEGPSLVERLTAAAPVALRAPPPVQTRLEWHGNGGGAVPAVQAAPHRELLPLLRVVGQMALTYVVAEGPDGMYLLDQHAAHERVMYDRIVERRAAAGLPATQPLLEPVLVELDLPQAATLEEFRPYLGELGLDLEPFGERAYLVRAVPAGIGATDIGAELQGLLERLAGERRVSDPFGRAAATVACHSSIRAGTALATEEMRGLVADLEKTASPRTCPHGRPTLIHVSTDVLERQFGRR